MQEITRLKETVAPWREVRMHLNDLGDLAEMAAAEGDESMSGEIEKDLAGVRKRLEALEFQALLSGPHDLDNAIVEINSGAGGTESCDWAGMLFRLYVRWAQSKCY